MTTGWIIVFYMVYPLMLLVAFIMALLRVKALESKNKIIVIIYYLLALASTIALLVFLSSFITQLFSGVLKVYLLFSYLLPMVVGHIKSHKKHIYAFNFPALVTAFSFIYILWGILSGQSIV